MKRSHFILIHFLLLVFCGMAAAFSGVQSPSGELLGQWQCQMLGEPVSLLFQSEDQLVFGGEQARYALAPGKLVVNDGYETVEYGYVLQGERLVLDLGDGFQMPCQRVGSRGTASSPTSEPSDRGGNRTPPTPVPPPAAGPSAGGSPEISSEEVGDPGWGFKFKPPKGWKWRVDHTGAVLGHDTIPGMILVIPHQERNIQSLNQQMLQGLREDNLILSPAGQPSQKGEGLLTCEITGLAEGQQVKGRGYGTLSPFGGGAYVLGITTPEKYGEGIADATDVISANISYFKVDNAALLRHFAGMWAYYSGGSGGGTLINYEFYPDGRFEDTSETSYNIDYSSSGWTTPDTNIGAVGKDTSTARWTARGSLEAGQIIVTRPDGSQRYIGYRIYQENGRKFSREYVFDGRHFSKRRDY